MISQAKNRRALLLGTHYHPVSAEDSMRVDVARDSLLTLRNVKLINLQYNGENYNYNGFVQLNRLQKSSISVTRRNGIKKPIVKEMLSILCNEAHKQGIKYFGFVNNDIIVKNVLLEIIEQDYDALALSRYEIQSKDNVNGFWYYYGCDMVIFKTDWFKINNNRFRDYIVGEAMWDHAYVPIMLCHGRTRFISNGTPVILHVTHPVKWIKSPFSSYNMYLSCLDQLYLNMYNQYKMWRKNAIDDEVTVMNEQMIKKCFTYPPKMKERIKQKGRAIKAFIRYRLQKWKLLPDTTYPIGISK